MLILKILYYPLYLMIFTLDQIALYAKRARSTPRSISEELRGWRWNEPPVFPSSSRTLGVSDVLSTCPTGRDVFLRYVKWVRSGTEPRGSLIHETYASAVETVKRFIYEGVSDGNQLRSSMLEEFYTFMKRLDKYRDFPQYLEVGRAMWDYVSSVYSSELDRAVQRSPFLARDSLASMIVPFFVEYPIDGSLVGLNQVRVDAFIPQIPMVAEMKTGVRKKYELSLAGYALAYESNFETPVDFGLLCYVKYEGRINVRCDFKVISDRMREEFLEERDKRLEILDKEIDPGLPNFCDPHCPFLSVCGGKR
jgi:CRISPR-associated protein Csa1